MKYLMVLVMFLFSQLSVAGEAQPAYLKDAVITVTLKDGTVYKFSANEYKVVKREEAAKKATPKAAETAIVQEVPRSEDRPYRVTIHGGVGFDGQHVSESANQVDITQKKAFVFGASLSRKVSDKISVGGTALSNQTYLLGVGLDFK